MHPSCARGSKVHVRSRISNVKGAFQTNVLEPIRLAVKMPKQSNRCAAPTHPNNKLYKASAWSFDQIAPIRRGAALQNSDFPTSTK